MKFCFTLIFAFTIIALQEQRGLPEGFVYVKDVIPDIILEMRYAGTNNFMGVKVTGYNKETAILTRAAANALAKVQNDLKDMGYCLKIFDAYRPQKAVDHFIKWSRMENDTIRKKDFYPNLPKDQLFRLGYIATRSGHSRGSTVDLTLVKSDSGEQVDMGGSYDFFSEISHYNTSQITEEQRRNRQILSSTMQKHGFYPYTQEWWHFTYRPEAFPSTYFDFDVE